MYYLQSSSQCMCYLQSSIQSVLLTELLPVYVLLTKLLPVYIGAGSTEEVLEEGFLRGLGCITGDKQLTKHLTQVFSATKS